VVLRSSGVRLLASDGRSLTVTARYVHLVAVEALLLRLRRIPVFPVIPVSEPAAVHH